MSAAGPPRQVVAATLALCTRNQGISEDDLLAAIHRPDLSLPDRPSITGSRGLRGLPTIARLVAWGVLPANGLCARPQATRRLPYPALPVAAMSLYRWRPHRIREAARRLRWACENDSSK